MTRSVPPPFWQGLLWGVVFATPFWLLIALAAHAVWQAWR